MADMFLFLSSIIIYNVVILLILLIKMKAAQKKGKISKCYLTLFFLKHIIIITQLLEHFFSNSLIVWCWINYGKTHAQAYLQIHTLCNFYFFYIHLLIFNFMPTHF